MIYLLAVMLVIIVAAGVIIFTRLLPVARLLLAVMTPEERLLAWTLSTVILSLTIVVLAFVGRSVRMYD